MAGMGLLHRLYARAAPEVWETETRLLSVLRLVRRPVAVQWIVTAACDLHCPHCYSSAGKRVSNELSTAEAKRLLVDELVALGKPTLVLAGGELLLRRDIPELIAYACEQGLEWAMHTHGGHVPKFRALLARHPPALAAISLDGERAQHDLFRGKGWQLRRGARCDPRAQGNRLRRVRRRHHGDAPERRPGRRPVPIVAKSGADSWGLHLFAPEGRGAEHLALFPTPEQLRRVAAFARRKRAEFHVELCNEWGSAGEDDRHYRDQPLLCGAGRISCVIGASGEVLPCTTTDLGESEGNLRDRPLRDIWARGFQRFRQRGHGVCSDGKECWLQSRGGERRLTAGTQFELRRLDVLRVSAATALQHPKFGALVLPVGTELTAWNVGEFLSRAARDELRAEVRRAQSGDTDALAAIEATIPAAHAELRLALSQKPDARGAAGLRLVLANFDQ